jgi:SAM-dependent methyltransferase
MNACPVCGGKKFRFLFDKEGSGRKIFSLYKCAGCSLELLRPFPSDAEIDGCYQGDYFAKRTDRGYDDYFSEKVRTEIERVFRLNLRDLDFDDYEKTLEKPFSLDIGCAAGYFVSYMHERGWNSCGIEVSEPCVEFAKKNNLNVIRGDYLQTEFPYKFDLITMWATIEHLKNPDKFIKKIFRDLKPGGILIVSTCRRGISFSSLFGKKWRFYNFPEHLCFFNTRNLKRLVSERGFSVNKTVTYGSGIGRGGDIKKKIADFLAKRFFLGDMILLSAQKNLVPEELECLQKEGLKEFVVLSPKRN